MIEGTLEGINPSSLYDNVYIVRALMIYSATFRDTPSVFKLLLRLIRPLDERTKRS